MGGRAETLVQGDLQTGARQEGLATQSQEGLARGGWPGLHKGSGACCPTRRC